MSGFWKNNAHADDIDYQIEADFSGLMSPGMPNTASAINDKIGHIMNYGDGWYGGVFVGAMYSLAFTSNDINKIVENALITIPEKSTYYQCIADVIKWHKQYPDDWKRTWFEIQKKWSSEVGCPEGIFQAFNIDSKINSAYIVLGLLYGQGDIGKSMEIATRAGQDADCNPSSVGGILGAMHGYDKIPAYWKAGLKEAESINFKYTTMSLNKVYDIGLKHALQNIKANGGKVDGDKIIIAVQKPTSVKFEQGFENINPVSKIDLYKDIVNELNFEFTGNGFILNGEAYKNKNELQDYIFKAELFIDGKKIETATFPTSYVKRRHELFWQYNLTEGKHAVSIKSLNANPDYKLFAKNYIYFF